MTGGRSKRIVVSAALGLLGAVTVARVLALRRELAAESHGEDAVHDAGLTRGSVAVAGSVLTVESAAVAGSVATRRSSAVAGSAATSYSSAIAGSALTRGSAAVAGSAATAFSAAVVRSAVTVGQHGRRRQRADLLQRSHPALRADASPASAAHAASPASRVPTASTAPGASAAADCAARSGRSGSAPRNRSEACGRHRRRIFGEDAGRVAWRRGLPRLEPRCDLRGIELDVDATCDHVDDAPMSPSRTAAMAPPSAASGAMCATMKPCVAPENRPSVIRATESLRPAPTIAPVTPSISRMPGPPTGPS